MIIANKLYVFLVTIFLLSLQAMATPGLTTYQAKIIKPDGYPLEANSVNFKFTILNPAGSCILYSETYSAVNMASTGGLISFSLGTGVKVYPVSATTFAEVFSNVTPNLSCDAGGPVSWSPSANDVRKIVMQFHDGNGWQTLPAMNINAVPYAMYASDSLNLGGVSATSYVRYSTIPTCTASEAVHYNGTSFSCLAVGVGSVTSGSVITALGYTPANSATVVSAVADISSVSSTVFSVSSTVTSLSNSVAASFAAISSSQWTTSGTSVFYHSGNVGIGTSNPTTGLHVMGTTTLGDASPNPYLQFVDGTGAILQWGTVSKLMRLRTRVASSSIVFDINTAEKMRIHQNGFVGIGTNSPDVTLDVSGGLRIANENVTCSSTYAGTLRYNAGNVEYCNGSNWSAFGVAGTSQWTTSGTNVFFNTGNVGLGVSVPTSKLDVAGSITATGGNITTNSWMQAANMTTTGSYYDSTTFNRLSFPGFNSLALTTASVERFRITSMGAVGINTSTPVTTLDVSGGVRISMESAVCTTNYAGTLRYNSGVVEYCNGTIWESVASATSVSNLAASVTALSSSAGDFLKNGTVSMTGSLQLSRYINGGNTGNVIDTGTAAGNNFDLRTSDADIRLRTINGNSIQFITNSSERMRVNLSGNVGIATSAPTQPLDVSGTAKATRFHAADGAFNNPAYTFASSPGTGLHNNGGGNLGISVGSALKGIWSSSSLNFNAGGAGPQIYFSGGSEANPSYAFNVDSDTGMFNPNASGGSNELAFSTSGTEKVRISSTGFVGIGTSAPTTRLHVAASESATLFSMTNSTIALQNKNTTSGALNVLMFQNYDGFDSAAIATVQSNSGNYGNNLVLVTKSNVGGIWNNDQLVLNTSGTVGIGTNTPTAKLSVSGGVRISMESATCAANYAGTLRYNAGTVEYCNGSAWTSFSSGVSTWAASGTAAIFNSGRVGIGTSNPARRLDVYATAGTSSPMALRTSDYVAGTTGSALLFDFGATTGNTYSAISAASAGGSSTNYLALNPAGGYVGIATSQPASVLDINGNTRVRDWLNVGYVPSTQNAGDLLILNGFNSAKFRMHASNSGGSQPTDGFHILTDATSTTLMNNEAGHLTLGTSATPTMVITSPRYVGIGTTAPGVLAASKTLTILDAGGTTSIELRGFESAGQHFGAIDFMRGSGATPTLAAASVKSQVGTYVGSGQLTFHTNSGTALTERMRINSDGKVGIGTSTPTVALDIVGDIQYTGTITDASDKRLKTNIEPLGSAISTVRKIKTYSYIMKDDPNEQLEYGVMAQDMLGIIPNLVKTIKGEYYGVNYIGLIPWSIRAIQEVDSETQNLRRENQEIKRELASIKEHNKALEQKLEKILQALEQQKHHGEQK